MNQNKNISAKSAHRLLQQQCSWTDKPNRPGITGNRNQSTMEKDMGGREENIEA